MIGIVRNEGTRIYLSTCQLSAFARISCFSPFVYRVFAEVPCLAMHAEPVNNWSGTRTAEEWFASQERERNFW